LPVLRATHLTAFCLTFALTGLLSALGLAFRAALLTRAFNPAFLTTHALLSLRADRLLRLTHIAAVNMDWGRACRAALAALLPALRSLAFTTLGAALLTRFTAVSRLLHFCG
jgi:hypothetical protein